MDSDEEIIMALEAEREPRHAARKIEYHYGDKPHILEAALHAYYVKRVSPTRIAEHLSTSTVTIGDRSVRNWIVRYEKTTGRKQCPCSKCSDE